MRTVRGVKEEGVLVIIFYLFSVIKENQSDLRKTVFFFFIFKKAISLTPQIVLLEGKTIFDLTSHFKFLLSIHNTLILNPPSPLLLFFCGLKSLVFKSLDVRDQRIWPVALPFNLYCQIVCYILGYLLIISVLKKHEPCTIWSIGKYGLQ